MTKTQMKALISENRLEELLEALKDYPVKTGKKERSDQIVVLAARLGSMEQDQQLGVIRDEHYQVEMGKIRVALLKMIDHLPEEQEEDQSRTSYRPGDNPPKRASISRKRSIMMVVMVAATILFILLGYYVFQPAQSIVKTEITTDLFSFRITEDWELNFFLPLTAFEAENLSATTGFYESTSIDETEPFDLQLEGDYLVLSDLSLQAGSKVTIQLDQNDVILSVSGAPVIGKIDLARASLQIPEHSIKKKITDTIPEILFFQSEPFAQFWLSKCDTCTYQLSGLTIDTISFEKLVQLDPPVLESSILAGTVTKDKGEHKIMLQPKDWLLLTFTQNETMTLKLMEGQLQVVLNGAFKEIRTGKKGALSRMPI